MYNKYFNEYNWRYTNADSDFRFVKFECTSTYPRLLFIIRFVPILKGLAIIHVYSQNKLSRNNDTNIQMEQGINCKEVDFIFGSFMKGNKNFEFKYGAPKKLEYVEKFMEEFFLTGRSSLNIFRVNNQNKKYKYVNYEIIGIINSFQITKSMGVEEIFTNFLNKLKQEYEQDQKEKKENEQNNSENNYNDSDDENDNKKIDKIFCLNKESFYNVLLNLKPVVENKKNKEIRSINMTSDNNNIDENLNINNLVNINSERINLVEDKTLSLLDDKDKAIKNSKVAQKFENTSIISEVKLKEKFEIKIVNTKKKKQEEENKEITNDNINSYSLYEKERNLNEILDIISSSSKYTENNKNQEDSEEIKSIGINKSRKRTKLSLIDKDNN